MFPETPSDIGSPNTFREPTRYRASCDRCQNIKVRCSKDKPACKRCARKGISCIYSPMRRMGRPRNAAGLIASSMENDVNGGNIPASRIMPESSTSASLRSSSDSHRKQGDSDTTDATSLVSVTTRTIISPKRGNGTNSCEVSGHLPDVVHNGLPAQLSNSETITSSQDTNPRTVFQTNAYSTNGEKATDFMRSDCYIAILARTTKLQQSLITAATLAPPIDLVLEAERDVRVLQQQCLVCTGHDATQNGPSCLQSDRPVLLSLALLAERVVTMLEGTFRVAVERTSTGYGDAAGTQDPSETPLPATAARRIERSFRGLLDLPCVFPIPAGNVDIRIGKHVVDGPVKARAVKKILQLRVRKLLLALRQMRTVPYIHGRRNSIGGGPLDWGGSCAVLDDAAEFLIKDMMRRMEALQGGLALMG